MTTQTRTFSATTIIAATLLAFSLAGNSAAANSKCLSYLDKAQGKYASCLKKADSKAVSKGLQASYEKCELKLEKSYAKANARYSGLCNSEQDDQVAAGRLIGRCLAELVPTDAVIAAPGAEQAHDPYADPSGGGIINVSEPMVEAEIMAVLPTLPLPLAPGPDVIPTDAQVVRGDSYDSYPPGLVGDEDSDSCSLDNYLVLELGSHVNAGSSTSAIELWLGDFRAYLLAPPGGYAPNQVLKYDFNNSSCPSCWDTMDADDWDTPRLVTHSTDGIQLREVEMVHADQTVLESTPGAWLDKYYGSTLDFTIETATTRWQQIGSPRETALYYASQELGQSGAAKYGGGDTAWCSEFTSWAIRQAGFASPGGTAIATGTMSTFFSSIGRHHTAAQVQAGSYMPQPGDYMSINSGGHSVLFVGWTSIAGATPAAGDMFQTIEGNTCNSVRSRERDWSVVDFVGATH
ncbi:MAG: hypothetical protein H8E45_11870 [Proteobacteria bacterium]|nr:hypothetical protein [Pseudomonadota bacterium]